LEGNIPSARTKEKKRTLDKQEHNCYDGAINHNRGIMRLTYEGLKFRGTLSEMKKFLEEKVRDEELKKLLEEKDKKDLEYQMTMMQGDNQSFSG
jgi:hypothetical protein